MIMLTVPTLMGVMSALAVMGIVEMELPAQVCSIRF